MAAQPIGSCCLRFLGLQLTGGLEGAMAAHGSTLQAALAVCTWLSCRLLGVKRLVSVQVCEILSGNQCCGRD
jgi:hypothetical protein